MDELAGGHVLTEIRGTVGHIRLNRPQALNALSHAMIKAVQATILNFATNDNVSAILITGAGERGLCAGGDIREIHASILAGNTCAMDMLRAEYGMNAAIAALEKPYISIMDGIVMGGGAGVSVHGSHRIVTERTRFAMPEAGIGFLPDIGATWLLSLPENEFGTYLGLTGVSIGAADALRMQLADDFVHSDKLPALIETLLTTKMALDHESLTAIIGAYRETPPVSPLDVEYWTIEQTFQFDSVERILDALNAAKTDFTTKTAAIIESRSPTSLKLTLALLRLGRQSERLADCQEREFAAASRLILTHDFAEGVRAAVIDKDRNPQWLPATLCDVDDAAISALLEPIKQPLFD